jgi:hypothetical protein
MRKMARVLMVGLVLTVCVMVLAGDALAWRWGYCGPVYRVGYCGPPVVVPYCPPVAYCAPVVRVRVCPPLRPIRYWGCW